jgi:hypothetical protein
MPSDNQKRWFSEMMTAGLEEKVFEPADVLGYATAEVLANHLPPDLMTKVLQSSLAAGAMTPEGVLETVTPEVMAEHLPHDVLWACALHAAERAGMTRAADE